MDQHSKLDFKTIILTLVITFSLTGCTRIITVIDIFGIIPPREQKLELQFERQAIGEPFSFADYCEEEYDSIFLVYPYFNTEREDFINLKMSDRLKDLCESNVLTDSYSTILFINRGIVKAYSIIATANAGFNARDVEKDYIFLIDPKFIMDKERSIHIYNG